MLIEKYKLPDNCFIVLMFRYGMHALLYFIRAFVLSSRVCSFFFILGLLSYSWKDIRGMYA